MRVFAKIVLPLVILGVAIAGYSYLQATRPKATPKPPEEKIWVVSATEIRYSDESPAINEFGTVVSGSTVELRPLVAGRIVEVGPNFVDGAVVRMGETLLVIDPFDYAVDVTDKEAALAESKAKLGETQAEIKAERQMLIIARDQRTVRERDLKRKRSLRSRGTSSRKAEDDALMAFNDSKQSVELRTQLVNRLTARLQQYEAAVKRAEGTLKRARRDLEQTRLVAPFNGYLAETKVAVGQRVGTSDRLARLIDAGRLEVHFQLTQPDFARLVGGTSDATDQARSDLIGKAAKIRWRVGRRSFDFDAVIARIGAEIEAASGGISVFARIENADLRSPLRPGAFVEVELPDRVYANVLRLPDTAVTDRETIYVVEKGRLTPHRVRVVRRVGKTLLVRADIPAGANVVTTPFPEIGPGIRVRTR